MGAYEPGRARLRRSRYFQASHEVASELADKVNVAYCMQGLAVATWARGEPRRAARLLEAAAAPLYAWADHELHQRAAAASREQLGEPSWNRARKEGRAMTFEQAVEYALEDAKTSSE